MCKCLCFEYSKCYAHILLKVNIFTVFIITSIQEYFYKEKTAVPNRTAEVKFNSYL